MPVRDSAACEWLKSAISGHSPTVGERLLELKAVIQRRLGDRNAPTLRG